MLELADILLSNCLKLCVCVGVAVTFNKAWEFQKGCAFCFFGGGVCFVFLINFWSYLVHCIITFEDVDQRNTSILVISFA